MKSKNFIDYLYFAAKKQKLWRPFTYFAASRKQLFFKPLTYLRLNNIIKNNYIKNYLYFFANIRLRKKDFVNHLGFQPKSKYFINFLYLKLKTIISYCPHTLVSVIARQNKLRNCFLR